MSEFQDRVNQSYDPILLSIPRDRWQDPKLPIGVMDKETHELIQIGDLYQAVNSTRTRTGGLVLRRSLRQPLTDVVLINEKQQSLDELSSDSKLRDRLADLVDNASKDEKSFYLYHRGEYATDWIGRPSLYTVYKGAIGLLGHLAHDLKDVKVETDYLNALVGNLTDFREDDVAKFVRGPVYKTFKGLKPKKEIGQFTPRRLFRVSDWTPGRLFAYAAPLMPAFAGLLTNNRELMLVSIMGMMLYMIWPPMVKGVGRTMDDKAYVTPLAEMYFNNSKIINAIESLGKIDELLSLANYAGHLRVPVTLPKVEDSSNHFFEAKGLRNPVLVGHNPEYVGNKVDLNGSRLTFLTGPNSGGKTSLSKTILQAQVLAQIGSYIPAEQARVAVADGIFYHSPMVNSLQDDEGRFGVEIARTKEIFFKTTPRSLVVLDELIEATTYEEKFKHSRDIMEGFRAIGGNTVLVTHNHELAEDFRRRGIGQFWQIEFDGSTPTHRIIPGISTESHSDDVLERVGFTREDIQRYLQEKGYTNSKT